MMIPPLPVGWYIWRIICALAIRLANLDRMQHRLIERGAGVARRQAIGGADELSFSGFRPTSYRSNPANESLVCSNFYLMENLY